MKISVNVPAVFFFPKFEWNFHFVALPATRNSLPPHLRSHPAELFRPDASKWVEWFFLSFFFFFFVFLLCLCNIVDLWRESAWMHSAEAGFERKKNRNQNTKTKKKKEIEMNKKKNSGHSGIRAAGMTPTLSRRFLLEWNCQRRFSTAYVRLSHR